ncbi:MAG: helix-turn-helix transcriptional regulator, partial [Clostridia bacterium]|nr:helix-turn-helix transcriptional regulator [Clostridia bacterium]
TLYTILKRLESARMLTVYSVEHAGRLRKYYRITPTGARRPKFAYSINRNPLLILFDLLPKRWRFGIIRRVLREQKRT